MLNILVAVLFYAVIAEMLSIDTDDSLTNHDILCAGHKKYATAVVKVVL